MKKYKSKSWTVILLSAVIMAAVLNGVCSCKAWRTITTTATYVQQNDSTQTKTTTTISTKTVEEYQGKKKYKPLSGSPLKGERIGRPRTT